MDGRPFYVVPESKGTLTHLRTNETYTTDGHRVYLRGRIIERLEKLSSS